VPKASCGARPLLSSPFLDEIAGRPVFVKCEALQHTGSFKFRGGWSALSALPEEVRARGVLAFSSGNHAQGVARRRSFTACRRRSSCRRTRRA
jgi:threonine dehydratase